MIPLFQMAQILILYSILPFEVLNNAVTAENKLWKIKKIV